MPYTRQIFQSGSQWTLLNAFSKSMKLTTRGCWNSTHCSMMLCRVKICSVQDRPCRNPACSSHKSTSTASRSLTSRTVQKAFPGTDSSVMLRQLLQLVMFPFFGNFTIMPVRHSSGICSSSQHLFISCVNDCTILFPPCFRSSAEIWSWPAALLFFNFFQCLLNLINCDFIHFHL